MMRPEAPAGPQQTATDDTPWWMKYGVRLVGGFSALIALAFGAWACITLTPRCLLAGISQMLIGVLVALIEAPFLCMFLDFAQIPSTYFDSKPPWVRGLLYVLISIIPISIYTGLTTIFGSGMIFVTGSLYGLTSLRRKAPPVQDTHINVSSSYNFLENIRSTGDIEIGSMQHKSADPTKMSGVM